MANRKSQGRSVSRVLSPPRGGAAIIYLGRPLPTGSPATREATYPPAERPKPLVPGPSTATLTGCLVLQAVGFSLPAASPPPRCALTAPFHLCLSPEGPSAVCFLWHYPWGCPRWPLATTVPCPARTFLPASFARREATARPTLGFTICQPSVYHIGPGFTTAPPSYSSHESYTSYRDNRTSRTDRTHKTPPASLTRRGRSRCAF
jgi:hypothetical protein